MDQYFWSVSRTWQRYWFQLQPGRIYFVLDVWEIANTIGWLAMADPLEIVSRWMEVILWRSLPWIDRTISEMIYGIVNKNPLKILIYKLRRCKIVSSGYPLYWVQFWSSGRGATLRHAYIDRPSTIASPRNLQEHVLLVAVIRFHRRPGG